MNEALILRRRQDIMDELNLALEAFRDDILPALHMADDVTIDIMPDDSASNTLIVSFQMKGITARTTERRFDFQVVDTAENFVNRVKAYLYDIIISVINLC